MNKLLNHDSFAHACASEKPDLTTFEHWTNKVYDFNAGFQNFNFGRLFYIFRGFAMYRKFFISWYSFTVINSFTKNIENSSESSIPYWYGNGHSGIGNFHATSKAISSVHSHSANYATTQMLLNFENNFFRTIHY